MNYVFEFDGWRKASKEARQQKVGCFLLCSGMYDCETKDITINLDIVLETVCYGCGGWCQTEKENCIEKLIEKFAETITHEHTHRALDKIGGPQLSLAYDKG